MTASRYGRLGQEYSTSFERGTVPSWWPLREDSTFAGSLTGPPSAPGGGIDLTTGGAASKAVGMRMTRPVDLTKVKMVEVAMVMTGGGDNFTSVFIGLRNAAGDRGGGVARNANNSQVFLRALAAAQVNVETTFQALVGATLRHSVGYRLFPNEVRAGVPARVAQLLVDGEVFAERTFTDAQMPLDQLVFPELFVANASGAVAPTTRTLHQLEYREYLR